MEAVPSSFRREGAAFGMAAKISPVLPLGRRKALGQKTAVRLSTSATAANGVDRDVIAEQPRAVAANENVAGGRSEHDGVVVEGGHQRDHRGVQINATS